MEKFFSVNFIDKFQIENSVKKESFCMEYRIEKQSSITLFQEDLRFEENSFHILQN